MARPAPKAEPSLTRGLVGIGVASIVALIFWFAFTYFVGARFKFVVIGLGAFIGWCGHWLAQQKSQQLGLAAALATALVFVLGMAWSARQEAYQAVNLTLELFWEARVELAQGAVKARTDQELRAFLSETGYFSDGESATPLEEIDNEMLAEFRREELPELRKIAEGKISRSTFERQHRSELESAFNAGFIGSQLLRFRNLTLLFLAVGAAWKLSTPS